MRGVRIITKVTENIINMSKALMKKIYTIQQYIVNLNKKMWTLKKIQNSAIKYR